MDSSFDQKLKQFKKSIEEIRSEMETIQNVEKTVKITTKYNHLLKLKA